MFRTKFNLNLSANCWFPGHMFSGLKKMKAILRKIDCVIEVHDARIPLSGRNEEFLQMVRYTKPHLLILNKCDLIDNRYHCDILKSLNNSCDRIFFSNSKLISNVKKIIPLLSSMIESSERFNRSEDLSYHILVCGVPNSGKSTLLNTLRASGLGLKDKVCKVGPLAGVTRAVSEKIKISGNPEMYVLDAPGILEPKFGNETALKMALCGAFSDNVVGPILIADYLLYWLNKRGIFTYVNVLLLPEPSDKIEDVLIRVAVNQNFFKKIKDPTSNTYERKPDMLSSAVYMIGLFRSGKFGKLVLDDNLL